ncbi:hypothetical protein K7711_33780 [Nocardia sp. CA2R105]|uniref:hypothetical protein n=1 Tax=Nocardia coffeae TaxID=2873381 RepID=UPI001CA654A3|nr:hypothetical protein [Nocardia coffeae]MBY8861488.1 hypothetical protein [Nocardia coffeae]
MTLEGNVAEPIWNAAIDSRAPVYVRGVVPVIRRRANRIDFPVVRHVTAQYFSHCGADRHHLRVTRAEPTLQASEPGRPGVVEFAWHPAYRSENHCTAMTVILGVKSQL